MERSGSSEREPYGYDRTPDTFDGLPEELKALRLRFRVGTLIIPKSSGCTIEPFHTSMIIVTTPDGQNFLVGNTRCVEWEE